MKSVKLSQSSIILLGGGKWPYYIKDGANVITLTPSEFNRVAAHAPVVKAQTAALRDALDWIEDEYHRSGREYYGKRSRVIEGAHAAIQGVEDSET